jgi:hypothetical protein
MFELWCGQIRRDLRRHTLMQAHTPNSHYDNQVESLHVGSTKMNQQLFCNNTNCHEEKECGTIKLDVGPS